MSQKTSFDPAIFVFDKPVETFPTKFRKSFVCCPKSLEKCRFWKTLSLSLNCSHGHVECSFNKRAKKINKRRKTSAQCRKMIKIFICFTKQLFLNKTFYRYGEYSFERPAKLFPPNCCNWSEKIPQKVQKLVKFFFFKVFLWRGRKQLESPAFFFDNQQNFFRWIFKK